MSEHASDKLWFIHMPRGLAALCVMVFHYSTMFINPTGVVHISHTQPIAAQANPMLAAPFAFFNQWSINLGLSAIAVFFLISGFVIPMTLEKTGLLQYVVRRVFRVYPLYITGLCATVTILFFYTWAAGRPYLPTVSDFAANASLIRDILWRQSIDGINWTLEIELKFYILCGLIAAFSSLRNAWLFGSLGAAFTVFAFATADAAGPLLATNLALYKLLWVASITATFVSYMLIGTCFFNLHQGHWRAGRCLITALVLAAAFLANASLGATRAGAQSYILSFGLGLVLFGGVYAYRHRLRPNRLLSWFSDISYPLYVVHGVTGYILITVLHRWTANSYVLIPVTSAMVIALAYGLHRFVEVPSNEWGRRLARAVAAFAARRPSDPAAAPRIEPI